ncbi:hypothetical protein SAMN04488034_101858 [Salinimicrobium catena]|uniref:Uncharacterized protein n=1 Tax=Salinimicrobium catena TaxID=390640 RepID=A0A1H5JTV9_9FLAO|nr:hypothetical protein [Salinimicrobium catena]SDK90463.1 hypothetical protein SAMN04488140_101844 [Salinimicrobium catena]SEE56043.1 hypothetical protein SAMN04488034_101858 [Salinimicrobium catena]
MKEKIDKLEDIRSRSEDLDPRQKKFPKDLKDLAQEALGYCEEADDQQEINWLKKAIHKAESLEHDAEVSQEALEDRDLGLGYLKEAVDSILIRERRYE